MENHWTRPYLTPSNVQEVQVLPQMPGRRADRTQAPTETSIHTSENLRGLEGEY